MRLPQSHLISFYHIFHVYHILIGTYSPYLIRLRSPMAWAGAYRLTPILGVCGWARGKIICMNVRTHLARELVKFPKFYLSHAYYRMQCSSYSYLIFLFSLLLPIESLYSHVKHFAPIIYLPQASRMFHSFCLARLSFLNIMQHIGCYEVY